MPTNPAIILLILAVVGVLGFLAAYTRGYRAGREEADEEGYVKYDTMRKAGLSLYMSGPWFTSTRQLPLHEQMILWHKLREALRLDPGTATVLKVSHHDADWLRWDRSEEVINVEASMRATSEREPAPATPLADTASEALRTHYRGVEGHVGSASSCWCGAPLGHRGPHASPYL